MEAKEKIVLNTMLALGAALGDQRRLPLHLSQR